MEFNKIQDQTQRRALLEIAICDSPDDDVSELAERLAKDSQVVVIQASDADAPLAIIAAQAQSGNSGYVWSPKEMSKSFATSATRDESEDALPGQALLQHALDWLSQGGATLAQALLDPGDVESKELFVSAGFAHLADLAYVGAIAGDFPDTPPVSSLEFLPITQEQFETKLPELAELVQRTYQQTQDCPAIADFRTIEETLAGYQGVGQFDPGNWFFVRHNDESVGCLILAEQLSGGVPAMELVYMGVCPEARGHGFGADIVRFAQWHSTERSAERIVLAVDVNNQPALAMYAKCGFGLWGQRTAMIKKL